MPLARYGVLKGQAVDRRLGIGSKPHYQIRLVDQTTDFRIAVNVKSQTEPSELLYFINPNFQHPITERLIPLELGFHEVQSQPDGLALDYIRGNLFNVSDMKPLPYDVAGPENDLNELLDTYIQRALAEENALVYAFGQRWGPENAADRYFGFRPGNGVHDIHMNQGNVERWMRDDGVWQDGGLLLHFPSQNQWVGMFLAFQSQGFHTDDVTGHRLDLPEEEGDRTVVPVVRIIAALVNPTADDPGRESVTLINTGSTPADMNNWTIADQNKRKEVLRGLVIPPGDTVRILLTGRDAQLSNKGGIITLLDPAGIKIHGVSYTKDAVSEQGRTVTF